MSTDEFDLAEYRKQAVENARISLEEAETTEEKHWARLALQRAQRALDGSVNSNRS